MVQEISTSTKWVVSTMTNRKQGNSFETELCEFLSSNGFWCHNFAVKKEGQPADVIAVRNGNSYLIDCKVCSTNRGFAVSRIEENQELSMTLWENCGNGVGWFAMLVGDSVYMVAHNHLKYIAQGSSYVIPEQIGIHIDTWVMLCG